MEPEDFVCDELCECGECEQCEADHERDMDFLLEQQELEDFEQADEYFNGWADPCEDMDF